MSELIISVSGLRGVVGESLTPPVAMRYACALAAELPAGPVLVSRDGRATGPMLCGAIQSALAAVGRDVIDAGIAATPTTGVLVQSLGCAGGIQISASHNPAPYNGMKLFSAAGRVIPATEGARVLEHYERNRPRWCDPLRVGRLLPSEDTISEHLSRVLATVEVEKIQAAGFHVLLDANHGAGSLLGARLLEKLGCQITLLGGEPNGLFAHEAEPTEENLAGVGATVVEVAADIGFCQDPDADRLAVIDATGRYVGEEYTLALCLDQVLRHTPGPVVINCASSRMSEDLAARHGVSIERSAVGEANVVDRMLATGAIFGGEGNGGPIDPRVGFVRDSFVGIATILAAMADRQRSVAELAADIPGYAIHKAKVELPREQIPAALDALEKHFHTAKSDRLDGLRLGWSDRWLLIRASNTEPIVRIIAETAVPADTKGLCEEAAAVIDSVIAGAA